MVGLIVMEFVIDPVHDEGSSAEVGGTTSATGFPKRVTRIGFFVERTRSSTARHLALNSEMAISCMAFLWWSFYHTMVNLLDHSKHAHRGLRPLDSRGRLSLRERFLWCAASHHPTFVP